jgi:hypothetical protein
MPSGLTHQIQRLTKIIIFIIATIITIIPTAITIAENDQNY